MFRTAPGVTIPFPEKIQEQFQVYEGNLFRQILALRIHILGFLLLNLPNLVKNSYAAGYGGDNRKHMRDGGISVEIEVI